MNNYQEKITKVLAHIETNLGAKHQLEELAGMVYLSKYHFHRIMTAYLNESLGAYIIRLKMDTAAKLLCYSNQPMREIAFKVGYETPAAFTKAFKKRFQVSPSSFRANKNSRLASHPSPKQQTNFTLQQEVKFIPTINIVFDDFKGGYNLADINKTWQNFLTKAHKYQLITESTHYFGISRDDPTITPVNKVRYAACISINTDQVLQEDEFVQQTIGGGKYLSVLFQGSYDQLGVVYQQIFKTIIQENVHTLRDEPIFDKYLNNYGHTPSSKLLTEICIPIE